jgi:hypothetical protein
VAADRRWLIAQLIDFAGKRGGIFGVSEQLERFVETLAQKIATPVHPQIQPSRLVG